MDNNINDKSFFYRESNRWIFITIAVLLSLFLLAKALHEFKLFYNEGKGVYPSSVVTISGKGEVKAIPNIASFTYSISEEALNVSDAQKKATDKENKALSFLKENGIEDKDIKTVNYNINPKYEYQQSAACSNLYCPPGKQVLKGYEVTEIISVKVRKTEDAGKILQGLGSIAVSNVSGLQFTVDDEDALKRDARKAAINDAKEKIDVLSKDLGVKVVKIVSFFEEGDQYPIVYSGKEAFGMGGDMMARSANIAPSLPQGENTVTSRVNITYEIK